MALAQLSMACSLVSLSHHLWLEPQLRHTIFLLQTHHKCCNLSQDVENQSSSIISCSSTPTKLPVKNIQHLSKATHTSSYQLPQNMPSSPTLGMPIAGREDQEVVPLLHTPGVTSVDARLCDVCLRIVQHISELGHQEKKLVKRTSFRESSAFCQLCKLITAHLWALRRSEWKWNPIRFPTEECPPYPITVGTSCGYRMDSRSHGTRAWISLESLGCSASLAIWADEGTPAARKITTRIPILVENVQSVSTLVRGWLYDCISHHEECVYSHASSAFVNDYESDLPTRLLEVTGTIERPTVRLVETRGQNGRYCALSHCWGAPELSPLKTMKENIREHRVDIPIERLPLTFREAVYLVRAVGIRYIWIDSLCIIQDDNDDWEREARVMGTVYQSAVLVIAAAASINSTEGLFVTERPAPLTLRVPYFSDGVIKGAFNLTAATGNNSNPAISPLYERAWASQEWYLARRMVFFMPGGLIWRCKEKDLDERGDSSIELYEHLSWLSFLGHYCDKKLTVLSDRLIAIQGIVSEMQKTRNSRFSYGVWEDSLTEQLLWRVRPQNENSCREPLDLPSWCWASTGTKKIWLPHLRAATLTAITQTIGISKSGSLFVAGSLVRLFYRNGEITICCVETLRELLMALTSEKRTFGCQEDEMLPEYAWDNSSHLIYDQQHSHSMIGLAVFDKGEVIQNSFCFLLASSLRETIDPLSLDFDLESQDSETSQIAQNSPEASDPQDPDATGLFETKDMELVDGSDEGSQVQTEEVDTDSSVVHTSSDEEFDVHDCIDFFEAGRSDHVYWALLVEPVDGKTKFRRVGLAMLYPRVVDMKKEDLTEFEIV